MADSDLPLLRVDEAEMAVCCSVLTAACWSLLERTAAEEGEDPGSPRRWAARLARRCGFEPGDLPDEDAGPAEIALWISDPLLRVIPRQGAERVLRRLRDALLLDRVCNDRSLVGLVALAAGWEWPAGVYPALFRMLLDDPDEIEMARQWLDASGISGIMQATVEMRGNAIDLLKPFPAANAIAAFGAVLGSLKTTARRAARDAEAARKRLEEAQVETARFRELLAQERQARMAEKRGAQPAEAGPCPSCADLSERLRTAEADRASLHARCVELERTLENERREAALSMEAMRDALAQAWGEAEERQEDAPPLVDVPSAPRPLAGLRVVVAGDESRMDEYRRLVEEMGGEFVWQPGYDEKGRAEDRLQGADAILAMCDWLSHSVFASIRRAEKLRGVPVAYCSRTGLATARAGLEKLAGLERLAGDRAAG